MAAKNTRNNNQSKSIPWGPMLLSFAVGAFVMFLIHLKDNVPADNGEKTAKKIEKSHKKGVEPKFDFYTLLPETEVVVDKKKSDKEPIVTSSTEHDSSEDHQSSHASTNNNNSADQTSYLIQVASFRNVSDADAYRAKLAFLGIESKVQTVTIDNKETWHRVQIGPIIGRTKADAIQKKLKDNNIDSLLMRSKQG